MVAANRLKQIACILIFIIGAFCFGTYWYVRLTIAARKGTALLSIAQKRKEQLLKAVGEQRAGCNALSKDADFKTLFGALSQASQDEKSGTYEKAKNAFDKFIADYQKKVSYKDIFLVQPDGTLFYTSKIELPKKQNLLKVRHKSALAQSFERVRLSLTADISEFATDPLLNMPALFISVPIIDNNSFIGVIAVLLDEEVLYRIIQNYEGLGKTGDIFVTKQIVDRVLFVAPSRLYANVAFKKITNPDKYAITPARRASLGYTGQGDITDSFGIEVVAAWLFVPQLDLGLTDGIQMSELLNPYRIYRIAYQILGAVWLILLMVLIFDYRHVAYIKRILSYLTSYRFLKNLSFAGFLIFLLVSLLFVYLRYNTYHTVFNATKELAAFKVRTQVNSIEQYINGIEKVADSIAQDLKNDRLKKEDLSVRIARDLKEFPDTMSVTIAYAPFAFAPQKRLYALQAERDADAEISIHELSQDYMVPGSSKNPLEGWFDRAMKKGAFWSYPFFDERHKKQLVLYAVPFYRGDSSTPEGVIMIVYNMEKILESIRQVEVGKTGYPIITSLAGRIIYHPLSQYASQHVTLLDITQDQNNTQLKEILEEMRKESKGFYSYFDEINKVRHWIYFERIKTTTWVVAVLFSQESLDLPLQRMHKQEMWLLISLVFAIICMITYLVDLARFSLKRLEQWAILITITLIGALIMFWVITGRAAYQPNTTSIIVQDQISLDKYVSFLRLDTEQRNEQKPIMVPTGIFISSLSLAEPNKITISATVWQRYTDDQQIVKGIRFAEATTIKMQEVFNKKEKGIQLIGWNVEATFFQKHRFSWFPFDRVHVDLIVNSADFEHNVVLVPDFSGYKSFDIDPLPGVGQELNVPGFTFERSFFSYLPTPAFDEVGLELLRDVTERPRLHYNLILARKLINPFIVFVMPLLIILFSIYAVFLVAIRRGKYQNMFQPLSSYVAVFFSLILLHQTLRTQYQAGELLYIEYFFFFTYITILLLVFHLLITKVQSWQRFILLVVTPYLEILFWPLQFSAWFIVTMLTFYTIR